MKVFLSRRFATQLVCRWLPLALLLAPAMGGCNNRGDDQDGGPAGARPAVVAQPQRDHLQIAMDYLSRLEDYEQHRGMVQTAYHINRWLQNTDPDAVAWQPTPLLADLPAHLRQIPGLADLGKLQISTDDVFYLREASWMRSISQWATEDLGEYDKLPWLQQLEQAQGEPHAHDVAVALRLFDWTVRNIQLEPLLAYPQPSQQAGAAAGTAEAMAESLRRAEAGPGYRTWPWQTLMFGRGDAWQRARVFIGLARQQEIDVVMLAIDAPENSVRPRLWLPAALIDDRLYLFDVQLGLPLPAAEGPGVATLQTVRQAPELLRRLDLGDAYSYPVAAGDLDRLIAMVDASPESLSRRMKLIESQPTTAQQLVLAVDPQQLAQRLASAGVAAVRLWQTPFETPIYRAALKKRAEEDVQLMRALFFEEWLFDDADTPLVRARQQHFRGHFQNREEKQGAISLYLSSRVPNTVIAQIATSPEVQQSLGIVRGRENDQQWQVHLQSGEAIVIRSKQNASFWIGLIHYETGRYEDARQWFQERCLEAYENGPWTAGARYNLARSLEQQGELEEARQILLLDDSPQKPGNLLRARQLREQLENTSG